MVVHSRSPSEKPSTTRTRILKLPGSRIGHDLDGQAWRTPIYESVVLKRESTAFLQEFTRHLLERHVPYRTRHRRTEHQHLTRTRPLEFTVKSFGNVHSAHRSVLGLRGQGDFKGSDGSSGHGFSLTQALNLLGSRRCVRLEREDSDDRRQDQYK